MKNFRFLFAIIFFAAFLQSCEKSPLVDSIAPELPLEESFIMSFDDFENADTVKSYGHWFHAASNVVTWNIILTLNLAIPTASFRESFQHNPQYQGDNTWLWKYGFNAEGQHFTAKLYGETINSNEVSWKMLISKSGGFSNVEWYTGVTAIDNSYATWTVNTNPQHPTTFIGIEYQADNGNGARSIRYTNQIPNAQGNGGYIEYQEAIDPSLLPFNRSYDVYKIEIDNLLDIDWNSNNNEGRVKDPQKFHNEDWHCWGADLKNTQC